MQSVVLNPGNQEKEDWDDDVPDNRTRKPNEAEEHMASNETTKPTRQPLQAKGEQQLSTEVNESGEENEECGT